eukprot:3941613-Rhodomonas_salina.6
MMLTVPVTEWHELLRLRLRADSELSRPAVPSLRRPVGCQLAHCDPRLPSPPGLRLTVATVR